MTRIGRAYENLIGCVSIQERNKVIRLNNGYLAEPRPAVSEEDIQMLADNVVEFSDWLKDNNISFIYANVGTKVCKEDKQLPSGGIEESNENADKLINLLQSKDVNVLDFRQLLREQYPDWYSAYYIADSHWKNTTALWGARVLASTLNESAGFDFDLNYYEIEKYIVETSDNYFLGSEGRVLTTAVAELEPFSKVIPRFDTDLAVKIPSRSIDIRGRYEETLFRENIYDEIASYRIEDHEVKVDAYSTVLWRNDALGTVQNFATKDNIGKRILMIQDSFGYYLSTYLALDVSRIDYVYLPNFTGSIKQYIKETKPDAVVFLLSAGNIKKIVPEEYDTHTHFFDLR